MDFLANDIFLDRAVLEDKLIPFGFALSGKAYHYEKDIDNGAFVLKVSYEKNKGLEFHLFDKDSGDEYPLSRLSAPKGSYSASLNEEVTECLRKIRDNCTKTKKLDGIYVDKLISFVKEKWGDSLEYLWENDNDNAVFRDKGKKWYGVIMNLPLNKFGIRSEEKAPVLVIKGDVALINNVDIFEGFHMNKKHWISLILDGRMELEKAESLLEISHESIQKKK